MLYLVSSTRNNESQSINSVESNALPQSKITISSAAKSQLKESISKGLVNDISVARELGWSMGRLSMVMDGQIDITKTDVGKLALLLNMHSSDVCDQSSIDDALVTDADASDVRGLISGLIKRKSSIKIEAISLRLKKKMG